MFKDQIAAAIATAATTPALDQLSRLIWKGLGEGVLGDDDAQALAEALHIRRGELRPSPVSAGSTEAKRRPWVFSTGARRYPHRDRSASLERRRRLAASGPMPPALAARFTVGELAVLRIIADEVRDRGLCDRTLGELAARAGVGRTTAQNAIRRAAFLGLLTVTERRRSGRPNLSNVIAIIAPDWLAWIAHGSRREVGGFKFPHPTDTKSIQKGRMSLQRHDRDRPGASRTGLRKRC